MERRKLLCLRCGHEWEKRREGRPVMCPGCHSLAWDKPPEDRLFGSETDD